MARAARRGTGILHIGLGAFFRAHQADYTHDAMMAAGGAWGIEPIALRNPDLVQVLNAQDGGFTLLVQTPDGPRAKTVSSLNRAHHLPSDPGAVIARFADPEIHVVTITVTEKGYLLDPASRSPLWDHPIISHDLKTPQAPQGVLGLMTAGLTARRAAGLGGLSLLSCDNLPENGAFLRDGLLAFARRRDPDLANWIEQECRFPSCMVDRITPAATADSFALTKELIGKEDRATIETEPFRQWVIEDDFAGPRPQWEQAGALIVPDVRPFERMKLRMLNGAHSLIAYLGAVQDFPAVRDVMARPDLAAMVRAHMEEVAGSLPPIPGFAPDRYRDDLMTRFANRAIDHRCLQIAMDGSQKLPQRIFDPAFDLRAAGRSFESCARVTAAWLLFLRGRSVTGKDLPLEDPRAKDLRACAVQSADDPALVEGIARLMAEPRALWVDSLWREAVCAQMAALRSD